MSSIRKQLLRWLIIGQLLAVTLAGLITYHYVRSELEDLFDDRLRKLALSVPAGNDYATESVPQLNNLEDSDDDFVIQIWKGNRLLASISHQPGLPEQAKPGFSTYWSNDMLWRSFAIQRGALFIQVSQPFSDRLEMSTSVALGAISPVLVLIVLLGGLVWVSVGRGLRPLNDLAAVLGRRRTFALDPLPVGGIPEEVLPLVASLNELLDRLGKALEEQRRFIADAAHELRTPLTAVQLQAQLLQRADSDLARDNAAEQIQAGIKRASHLVHQLLTLARMEPEEWQRSFSQVDLSALLKTVLVDHSAAAEKRQIDLGITRDTKLFIEGDGESLRIMLGNLIDNAIRYTPQGGRINVGLSKKDVLAQILVEDSGPGIPKEERGKVFKRFYRQPGTREMGSGLGLAIVQEVVSHHGGEIVLGNSASSQGLEVVITLPITQRGSPE